MHVSLFFVSSIDLTYFQKNYIAQEAESHPELIPDLFEVLGCQKDDPKYKKLKGGTLVMQMLIDWEKAHNANNQKEEARRALARKLYKKSTELMNDGSPEAPSDHDGSKAIRRIANNLDIYFDPEALS